MPALLAGDADGDPLSEEALAVKVVSVFDRNAERGLARIQAAVLVFDAATGQPTACLEGATLTGIRTAAASGAATDLLARTDCRTVAIFGAGVQGRTHLEAVCTVREIETAWIYSRTPSKVDALIAECAGRGPIPQDLRVATTPQEALAQADIVCAATTSREPIFNDADLQPGTHINAVGSYQPHVREIPGETVARAVVIVDNRDAAWEEAGDLIQPLQAGLIDRNHIVADLGEVVLGVHPGRRTDEEITLFKSVGIAVQDAAAAHRAVNEAMKCGLGQTVPWAES